MCCYYYRPRDVRVVRSDEPIVAYKTLHLTAYLGKRLNLYSTYMQRRWAGNRHGTRLPSMHGPGVSALLENVAGRAWVNVTRAGVYAYRSVGSARRVRQSPAHVVVEVELWGVVATYGCQKYPDTPAGYRAEFARVTKIFIAPMSRYGVAQRYNEYVESVRKRWPSVEVITDPEGTHYGKRW